MSKLVVVRASLAVWAGVLLMLAVGAGPAQAAYRDSVFASPSSSLTSYWRLGEASGTVATDSNNVSSGAYAGTPVLGATGALPGDPNKAITVDSAGDRFSVADRAEYANVATVELWIKLNAYGDTTQYRSIVSKGVGPTERNFLIALGNNSNGQLTYGFGSGGSVIGRRSVASLQTGAWTLIDYVKQPGSISLYINGALDSSLSTTATPATSTQPIILGDDGQTASFASASYDDLSVYSSALSASTIGDHYRAGATPTAVCTKVASPSGSDSAAGTAAAPYLTAQKLATSLTAGQTGCLRAGTYVAPGTNRKLSVGGNSSTNNSFMLQTYPGDATATISGSVLVYGANVTLQELKLDSTSSSEPTGVTVDGPGSVLRHNDITSGNTKICVITSDYLGVVGDNVLIERNRIHNCGDNTPVVNQEHGIYLSEDGATVRNNVIYANNDRGVQLYPDADNNLVQKNTIDANGEGVLFGGGTKDASSTQYSSDNNTVRDNIISNSNIRWLVEANTTLQPVGNTVVNNCLYATNPNLNGYYNHPPSGDGIDPESSSSFSVSGSIVANPGYNAAASGDYRLAASSPCTGKGAPADILTTVAP